MNSRQSHSTRRFTVWFAAGLCSAALAGCGHSGRSFLARLPGGGHDTGHTSAGIPDVPSSGSPAGRTRTGVLTRDPFLDQGPLDSPVTAELEQVSGTVTEPAGAGAPPGSEGLAYLDRQLERLEATLSAQGGQHVRPIPSPRRESAVPLAARSTPSTAPSTVPDPRTMFEHLARREASVMEELAPSPRAGQSHLSMIVDSHVVPPRLGHRSGRFSSVPAPAAGAPDFLGIENHAAGGTGQGVPVPLPTQPLFATADPPTPPGFDSSEDDDESPELLPAIEVRLDVDAPPPPAPDVGGLWRRQADHPLPVTRRPGDKAPRALEPIEFGEQPETAATSNLSRFRGPLIIVLGLLLVAGAAAGMRRPAGRRA
ncbi:MAG TPA: hypothetical protein VML55_21295 [Planctomycetaceae bacterium]|nr:hypothetical protein [Planctomycetaceae bacterium]